MFELWRKVRVLGAVTPSLPGTIVKSSEMKWYKPVPHSKVLLSLITLPVVQLRYLNSGNVS
jgi:hypothetical protein